MNAAQIAAQLKELDDEYKAGNIGWLNYKTKLAKLIDLGLALANRVALIEAKLEPKGE